MNNEAPRPDEVPEDGGVPEVPAELETIILPEHNRRALTRYMRLVEDVEEHGPKKELMLGLANALLINDRVEVVSILNPVVAKHKLDWSEVSRTFIRAIQIIALVCKHGFQAVSGAFLGMPNKRIAILGEAEKKRLGEKLTEYSERIKDRTKHIETMEKKIERMEEEGTEDPAQIEDFRSQIEDLCFRIENLHFRIKLIRFLCLSRDGKIDAEHIKRLQLRFAETVREKDMNDSLVVIFCYAEGDESFLTKEGDPSVERPVTVIRKAAAAVIESVAGKTIKFRPSQLSPEQRKILDEQHRRLRADSPTRDPSVEKSSSC